MGLRASGSGFLFQSLGQGVQELGLRMAQGLGFMWPWNSRAPVGDTLNPKSPT